MCEPESHAPTPVGETCLLCEETVEDGDSGVLMGYSDGPGTPGRIAPEHRNCFLRTTVGSVGHQLGKCSCFNDDPGTRFDDPPGLSRREAADAAVELFERQGYVSRPFRNR